MNNPYYTQASQQTCQLLFKKVTAIKQTNQQQAQSNKKISMKQFAKQTSKNQVKQNNKPIRNEQKIYSDSKVVVYRTPVMISTDSQINYRNYNSNKPSQKINSEKVQFYHSSQKQKPIIFITPQKPNNLKQSQQPLSPNFQYPPSYPKQLQNSNNLNGSKVVKKFINGSPKISDMKSSNVANNRYNFAIQHPKISSQQQTIQSNRSQQQVLQPNKTQYQLMQYLQEQNRKLQKIIQQQYLPMKEKYNALLKEREQSDYLISKLEWKLKQLKKQSLQ